MSSPYRYDESIPPLVDQEMPNGTWVATLNSFMVWFPRDNDITLFPQGPIEAQVHDEGTWSPGAGNSMTWLPGGKPAPEPMPPLEIVNVPGDEPQPGDDEA